MTSTIHPYSTEPDLVVLRNLFADVESNTRGKRDLADDENLPSPEIIEKTAGDHSVTTTSLDEASIARLKAFNDPTNPAFQPTVFTTWDESHIPPLLNNWIVRPYARVAMRIVRHPTDVVFLTHLLLYSTVNLGSAVYLFLPGKFTYWHGVAHAVYTLWCAGSFTLMLHNHIHNNGVCRGCLPTNIMNANAGTISVIVLLR